VPASIYGRQLGIVSGIAPRAHVMAYKICGDQGCFGSDSVAAVNAAVLDGVDVINFSISGGANPYSDAVSLAFLGAYNAGVFVAASAGNSGPGPNTTDHREPWTTTVAASTTTRQFESALALASSDGAALLLRGASVTRGVATPSPVHVPAGDPLCQTPFAAGSVAGKMVVCLRGINARTDKSYNVSLGGAVGMILLNPSLQGLATDNHFVPSVHLEVDGGNALNAFLAAHPNVAATMTDGSAAPAQGDVMASFSSRGGTGLSLGIAKPDVTAPGVQILAGATPQPATREGGFPGQLFQAIQGTSMSSPHVAGAAALLLDLHPTWTPGQVKSALMTTASTLVVKEDGVTLSDPFDRGSGRIDLSKAGDPGLLFDETGANYVALQSSLWDANYPSLYVPAFLGAMTVQRTVQNTRNAARDWKLSVIGPTDLKVSVPTTISVPAGGSATFGIELDGRGIPLGEKRHAVIELKRPNEAALRFPVTVVRGAATVPLSKSCSPLTFAQNSTTQCTIAIANMTFNPANVFLTDLLTNNQLALVPGSVVNATELSNGLQFSGVLAPAQPAGVAVAPGGSPAGGYLPLSAFGIPPIAGVGDDTITNFNVPAFLYGGEVNGVIGVSSNGYLVIGGGSGADNSINNQNFPNVARPNNVLAPFWTDLNPGAAGAMRIGTLTDGADTWIVVDWEGVREFSSPRLASFQVWIGVTGDANPAQDISFAYGTIMGNGDGGFLSVGAENRFGNRGATVYFNGTGSLPANGTQLVVTGTPGTPGETRTVTFSAIGKNKGSWTNCAEMTSNAYFGKQTACVSGTVTGK
jgi:subtilisin family serine protease